MKKLLTNNSFLFSFCLLIFSCCNNKEDKKITGEIKLIELDYVKEYRDYCRFTRIYFEVEIKNNSQTDLILKKKADNDYCNLMEIEEDLTLIIPNHLTKKNDFLFKNGKLGLCFVFPNKSFTIKSNKSEKVRLILQQDQFRTDLKYCLELYKDFLNEKNFTIVDHQKRFIITSSKTIKSNVRNDNEEMLIDWSKIQAFSTSN